MLDYLKKPYFIELNTDYSLKENLRYCGKLFLFCYLAVFVSAVIMFFFDTIILKELLRKVSIRETLRLNSEILKIKYGLMYPVHVVLIGPIIEEIIFRLSLNLKKSAIAICISLIIYRLLGNKLTKFDFSAIQDYLVLLISIATFFLIKNILSDNFLEILKSKYYPFVFYFFAITFALVHVNNFAPIQYNILYVYPIYVLPQFAMGLFFGYIRVKRGIIWSILLHMAVNLPSVLFG
jgi:hypothetical protein